jgi:hypothetical protein
MSDRSLAGRWCFWAIRWITPDTTVEVLWGPQPHLRETGRISAASREQLAQVLGDHILGALEEASSGRSSESTSGV